MRVLGWMEMQTRAALVRFTRDRAGTWLRWAREAHHGDVALACLDRAVRLGDMDAVFEHGLLEMEGLFGVEPAPTFRRAADRGHVEAMTRLAGCLRWGPGLERNEKEARAWLLRAAEAGFRPAAEQLAKESAEQGEAEQAAQWRERAAAMAPRTLRQGLLRQIETRDPVLRSQIAAGRAVSTGFEAMARQPWAPPLFSALFIALALASLAVFVMASFMTFGLPVICIATYYLLFGRRQRHTWRFRRQVDAAEAGDAEAAFALGSDYLKGMPGSMPDALSAAVWFRRAAERGHRGAMKALAEALRTGHGVRRDPQEAEAWAAASQG